MMNKCFLTTCITYKILFQFSEGTVQWINVSTQLCFILSWHMVPPQIWSLVHFCTPNHLSSSKFWDHLHFPFRPPPHDRQPWLSTNNIHSFFLNNFLTTSAFQIVLRGEYLNCLAHLSVLLHFVLLLWIPEHLSVLSILKKIGGGLVWVCELSWPTWAFFFILLVCCESLTTSVFRAF